LIVEDVPSLFVNVIVPAPAVTLVTPTALSTEPLKVTPGIFIVPVSPFTLSNVSVSPLEVIDFTELAKRNAAEGSEPEMVRVPERGVEHMPS